MLIVVVISNIISLHNSNTNLESALVLRAQVVSEAQAAAMSHIIWEYDQESALASMQGLLDDPEFVRIIILDDTGKEFAKVEKEEVISFSEKTLVFTQDVYFASSAGQKRAIGKVKLEMTRDLLNEKLWRQTVRGIVEIFLLLLLVVPNLFFAIRKFTKPLEDMTLLMRSSAQGDHTFEVNQEYLKRNDEVGAIANSIMQDQQQRRDEIKLLELAIKISHELNIDRLLGEITAAITQLLEVQRGSIFRYDSKNDLLWSRVIEGTEEHVIQVKPGEGIAGKTFLNKEVIVTNDAYKDSQFDSRMDKKTGFRTKNILSVPILRKQGECLGVLQVLNKKEGGFSQRDQRRALSLASQAAISLENGKLFEEILNLKNYQESILESLTNGVITFDEKLSLVTANIASRRVLNLSQDDILGSTAQKLFAGKNAWIPASLEKALESGEADLTMDVTVEKTDNSVVSLNTTAAPLMNINNEKMGAMLIIEDITAEKRIRSTMARYMSKEVVERILSDDPSILKGSLQNCTVLFSDIRKFTTISEQIGARNTVNLLNSYFEEMVSSIMDNGGILDKYIGDAIMASFGVPFTTPVDADNAIVAAIAMMRKLRPFNQRQKKKNEPIVEIGIGLNTGELIAGNIGSSKRLEYTVIGDTVNLASRIEGTTKFYGAPIVASKFTIDATSKNFQYRFLDYIQVKGKSKPVLIVEIMDHYQDIASFSLPNLIEVFNAGFASYQEQNFAQAQKHFQEALKIRPEDEAAQLYIERSTYLQENPPSPDWDGVWVMKTK